MSQKEFLNKDFILNNTLKDSVFTDLFGDTKNILQLYKALHPDDDENITIDDLNNITLHNVVTNGIYNDLGFLVKDKLMILVEAQSTWTNNIIIRGLIYAIHTYYDYIITNDLDVYSSNQVELPKPELYMIYVGDRKDRPDKLNFKDKFFDNKDTDIDATIHVLYGKDDLDDYKDENIINQYIAFCKVYKQQYQKYECYKNPKNGRKAIEETLKTCRDKNVLKTYLKERESEVIDMMSILFDQATVTEIYGKSQLREGEKRGIEKGRAREIIDICSELKMTHEEIVQRLIKKLGIDERKATQYIEDYNTNI